MSYTIDNPTQKNLSDHLIAQTPTDHPSIMSPRGFDYSPEFMNVLQEAQPSDIGRQDFLRHIEVFGISIIEEELEGAIEDHEQETVRKLRSIVTDLVSDDDIEVEGNQAAQSFRWVDEYYRDLTEDSGIKMKDIRQLAHYLGLARAEEATPQLRNEANVLARKIKLNGDLSKKMMTQVV